VKTDISLRIERCKTKHTVLLLSQWNFASDLLYLLVPAANINMRHEKQHYYVEMILIRTLGRGGEVFDESSRGEKSYVGLHNLGSVVQSVYFNWVSKKFRYPIS
jgi:hypothetical protein